MKTSTAIVVATLMTACGGSVATGISRTGVSVDFYGVLPATPQSVSIDIFTPDTSTLYQTVNVPNCTSSVKTACWDAAASKFTTYAIDLPGTPTPGTDYWLTVKFWTGAGQTGTAVGIIPLQNVKVISGKVNAFTIKQDSIESPAAPGVFVSSVTSAATVVFNATKGLSVTATDPSAAPGTLSYLWALGTGSTNPGCGGSTLSANGLSTITFTAGTTAGACKVTVTVGTSTAGVPAAVQSVTLTVAQDATISVNGVPPPIITSVGLATTNTADVACSIAKPGAGWAGANTTCPRLFGLAANPLNPANRFAAQSYFGDISVSYDVTTADGYNPAAPPTISATVFCTGDAADYGTDPTKGKSVGFNPGYQVGNAGTVFATDSYWAEPGFTITLPAFWDEGLTYAAGDKVLYNGVRFSAIGSNVGIAPDDAVNGAANWAPSAWVAADYAKKWTANPVCTFTVKVTNEGGSDSLNFYAFFQ